MFVTQYNLLFICVKRCESLPQLERQNNALTSNPSSNASRILITVLHYLKETPPPPQYLGSPLYYLKGKKTPPIRIKILRYSKCYS